MKPFDIEILKHVYEYQTHWFHSLEADLLSSMPLWIGQHHPKKWFEESMALPSEQILITLQGHTTTIHAIYKNENFVSLN